MKRNMLLVFVLIISSLLLAAPFGYLLNKYVFVVSGGFSTFSIPTDLSAIINGLPVSYLFLIPILFTIFGKQKKIMIILMSLPMLIFSFIVSMEYLFWSVVFFITGIVLSVILQKISKLKHPNPGVMNNQ